MAFYSIKPIANHFYHKPTGRACSTGKGISCIYQLYAGTCNCGYVSSTSTAVWTRSCWGAPERQNNNTGKTDRAPVIVFSIENARTRLSFTIWWRCGENSKLISWWYSVWYWKLEWTKSRLSWTLSKPSNLVAEWRQFSSKGQDTLVKRRAAGQHEKIQLSYVGFLFNNAGQVCCPLHCNHEFFCNFELPRHVYNTIAFAVWPFKVLSPFLKKDDAKEESDCPLACEEVQYSTDVSTIYFPSRPILRKYLEEAKQDGHFDDDRWKLYSEAELENLVEAHTRWGNFMKHKSSNSFYYMWPSWWKGGIRKKTQTRLNDFQTRLNDFWTRLSFSYPPFHQRKATYTYWAGDLSLLSELIESSEVN